MGEVTGECQYRLFRCGNAKKPPNNGQSIILDLYACLPFKLTETKSGGGGAYAIPQHQRQRPDLVKVFVAGPVSKILFVLSSPNLH